MRPRSACPSDSQETTAFDDGDVDLGADSRWRREARLLQVEDAEIAGAIGGQAKRLRNPEPFDREGHGTERNRERARSADREVGTRYRDTRREAVHHDAGLRKHNVDSWTRLAFLQVILNLSQ